MNVSNQLTNLISSRTSYLQYEEDNICPVCKSKISPVYISCSLNSQTTASVFNYCRGCNSAFVTTYEINKSSRSTDTRNYYYTVKILSSVPNTYKEEQFSEDITLLSPSFVKIYNQSLAAETSSLDEIAGLGYRKALEFLVKDYAISEFPEEADNIKTSRLSNCINKYIDDPRIKTLAEKSAWIGNDEAHYVRKQEDHDVEDMKSFIKAAVFFISMVQITKTADTIEPK